jgi:NADH:ubiquinone oxidoreductase subunit K
MSRVKPAFYYKIYREKVGEVIRNPKLQDGSIWLILTIAVACIGVFLALLLFILYRRKSTSHNRELRYLKAQMNSM